MTNEPNQFNQTNPTHLSNQSSPPHQSNDATDGSGDFVIRPMDDALDALLRQWHHENAARAAAQRDTLLRAVAASNQKSRLRKQSSDETTEKSRLRKQSSTEPRLSPNRSRSSIAIDDASPRSAHHPRLPLASSHLSALAAILLLGGTIALFLAAEGRRSDARADVLLASEGGKLDAVDARGQLIGPCPLKHTDVDISVSGISSRVTVRQRYANPYPDKIEAVYTFPLSHRAAVDRMTMTLGDRVIVGEVKEREQAKAIYQAAKSAGHVAGLLEQERPNIFTQSVANIEPGVEIVVEISYVELLESRDGVLGLAFPMVVAPRYIPGNMLSESAAALPANLRARRGLILYGPATATLTAKGDTTAGEIDNDRLTSILSTAQPIDPPEAVWWSDAQPHHPNGQPVIWAQFQAAYAGGGAEAGVLYTDGTGQLGGRWFYVDPKSAAAPPAAQGAGFAANTTQVPDAARITPMPVKPPTRAGHDISITVHLDTGGPGITDLASESHEIHQTYQAIRADGAPREVSLSLKEAATIPNKDFVLHWKQTADTITEQVFTHAGPHGNFITVILNPPERVQNDQVVPRELVFVLDTSGSMQGFPIEKAKEVMSKAIAALRPHDTFNLITFSGDTRILWDRPQPASTQRLAEAQTFLAGQSGNGGTEMMAAINAALEVKTDPGPVTIEPATRPIRIVCFMTDGEVGNDLAIIDAVKKNAGTTRVFSFGIGNSVNRYLLDSIALAGRGAAEYVLLNENADAKVAAFSQRIQSPVLIDPRLEFSPELQVIDRSPEVLPDLYDVAPVIVHARCAAGGKGTVTLRGQSGGGAYERTIEVDATQPNPDHDVIATLWARAKVDDLMHQDLAAAQSGNFPEPLRKQVVALGETFGIMTQFTSFVAVENLRVTIGGEPKLVPIPIELPDGQSWEGTMGEAMNKWAENLSDFATPAAGAMTYPNFDGDNASATGDLWMYADEAKPNTTDEEFEIGMEEAIKHLRFSKTNVPNGTSKVADTGDASGLMIYHLKHKTAYDIAFDLEDMLKPKQGTGPEFDEGSDAKIMIGKNIRPEHQESIRKLIEMFDVPNDASAEDAVLALEDKDIPPEVLARIAKEVAEQSGKTVAPGEDVLLEAEESIIPWRKDILYPKNWAEITAKRTESGMAGSATTNPPSVEDLQKGGTYAGATFQGFNGEPFDAPGEADRFYQSLTQPRQPVLGDLPAIGKAFAAAAQSKSSVKGKQGGPETGYYFDTRSQQTGVAPPAPPFQPPAPSPAVDMWALLRANNPTPRGFICPSTTDLPDPAQDTPIYYDFLTDLHLSYSYQYSNGAPSSQPTADTVVAQLLTESNPHRTAGASHLNREGKDTFFVDLSTTVDPRSTSGESVNIKGIAPVLLEVSDSNDPIPLGGETVYTVTVTNVTNKPVTNVVINTVLPEALRPLPRGTASDIARRGNRVLFAPCTMLPPKGQVQWQLRVRSVAAGDLRVTTFMRYAESSMPEEQETESTTVFEGPNGQKQLSAEAIAEIEKQWGNAAQSAGMPASAPVDSSPAASPRLLVDQLLLQIAALYQSDRALDALALADSLLKLRPNHRAAQAMRDAIASGVLNEPARARILAAHAARAARRLAALAETTKTLVKHLDERLLRLAMGDASADARQGLSITDAGVQAALLLADVNDARLKSLKAAGVTIESVSKPTHVVIGRVPAEKLSQIALTDGLRRAEAVAAK